MIIVLMGVAGVGKTTVGELLAAELHWRFADADDYHSPANIAKMRAGIPLTDTDRGPWLQALHDAIKRWLGDDESVVLACSALKAAYRERLLTSPQVKLVYLKGSPQLVALHLSGRHGHYMNPDLLPSQFATLEEPRDAVVVDAGSPLAQVAAAIRRALQI